MLGTKGSGMDVVLHSEVEGVCVGGRMGVFVDVTLFRSERNGPIGGGIENGCREEMFLMLRLDCLLVRSDKPCTIVGSGYKNIGE